MSGRVESLLNQGSQCQGAGTRQAEPLELSYTIPWGQEPVSHRERKAEPFPHRDVHQQVDAGKDAGVGEGVGNLVLWRGRGEGSGLVVREKPPLQRDRSS